MSTIEYTGILTIVTCWCGMVHAVPKELHEYQQRRHNNGEQAYNIYCPLGHTWVPAGKGAAQVEREKREVTERRLRAAQDLLLAEERSHAATRGQLTKVRKKAAAAMCPVEGCGRQFVNMANHLHAKHPDFAHPANNGKSKPDGPVSRRR